MSQMHLHSENFDLCRICLLEPESNRNIKFVHIFTTVNGDFKLKPQLEELLGIKIESNDVKPKMICNNCYKSLFTWYEMKKKASESDIVINYIASKKFGANNPGTSMASNSSLKLRDKKQSNKNKRNLNECSSSSSGGGYCKREDSSRSLNVNNSKSENVDDSDDCVEVKCQVDVIEIISDDENSESVNNNIKNECIYISDDNESVNNNIKNEFIINSSEDEFVDNNINHYNVNNEESADNSLGSEARGLLETTERINNEDKKLYYCSICQKNDILNHDCSKYNINFSTCLVPNCNILSRSKSDFLPHYQLHIGMSSSAVMCDHCYQEIKRSDSNVNGFYHCCAKNAFKCYTCNVTFNNMKEFAYHKLKKHNGRLMDSLSNYLCLYCEESSPELTDIIDHIKQCLENQTNNVPTIRMKLRIPTLNKTELLPVPKKTLKKNVSVQRKRRNKKKNVRTSNMILFTCLKPSCNLIFQSFTVFKHHYREHFEIGDKLVCWQCCKSFSDLNALRIHQVRCICCIPGMFKCYRCPKKFDDIQCLSIHKYTYHDGHLIAGKKNSNTIKCAFCKLEINISNFKSHLTACEKKNIKKTTKCTGTYECQICDRVFHSVISLSNHMRIHKPSR